jgi:hypothetical protein
MSEPRAFTKEELRKGFLDHLRIMARYWAASNHPMTKHELCESVIFSVLCAIDGVAGNVPFSLDLVARPHPDDKQSCIEDGENWVKDGMVINDDGYLHDEWFIKKVE